MTKYVPISITEIIEEVHQACEIGITVAHIHARDENGEPTYRADTYGKIIDGIRKFDKRLVICVSLSGRNYNEFEKRSEPLQLTGISKPDMGSLTLSSLNFTRQASMNSPDMIQKLAIEMEKKGILPELEAFDVGMINYAKYLILRGFVETPYYINLLVGNISGAQMDLVHIGSMIKDLPSNGYWALAGIGDSQLPANTIGIMLGGGVRIGLEDNIYLDRSRTKLATNIQLLERVHVVREIFERELMSSKEFRDKLNLCGGDGSYGL